MTPLVMTGQPLPGGIKAVFPLGLTLNLNQDVNAHEVGYRFGQALFVILERRTVYAGGASQDRQGFALDQAVDDGFVIIKRSRNIP